MALSTKDFTTLVQDQVAAIQGAATTIIDVAIGSIIRSMVESNTGVVLWLQGLLLKLLATTRASTSSGSDLDSFVNDYGLTRIPATYASGQETFSRFTPSQIATIPVGSKVQTADGSQTFHVIADITNGAYSPGLQAYSIPINTASITIAVVANAPGISGNALSGTVNTLASSIVGIDTVTNSAVFVGGSDAESDSALRTRFIGYIASLARATKGAIGFAIQSVEPGVVYNLVENQLLDGTYQPGYFYAIVDDGSGNPPTLFLNAVQAAVDAVRPFTSTFGIFGPTVVMANINMTLVTDPGYVHADVVAAVLAALQAYVNSLSLAQTLSFTRLSQIAYNTSPGVLNVTGVTLNAGTSDLTPTSRQLIKFGTSSIT